MEVHLAERDLKMYNKLYVSCRDIRLARFCAKTIIRNNWHYFPWELRASAYAQQSVFTTTLVTSYARPFTKSKGWPSIPKKFVFSEDWEKRIHLYLMSLRHTVYAHSDSAAYNIRPWKMGDFATDIVDAPPLRLSAEELSSFMTLTEKQISGMEARMVEILATP